MTRLYVTGALGLLALLLAPLAQPSQRAAAVPAPTFCEVRILRDYDLVVTYFAIFRLAPGCPEGGVGRIRKTSTLNTKANGARYQPIRPEVGAWELTADGTTVPFSARWTLNTWEWQYWSGSSWQPMKSAHSSKPAGLP